MRVSVHVQWCMDRLGGPSYRVLSERLSFPLLSCRQTKCRTSMESPVITGGGLMRTKPLIPEMCFATTTEEDSECEKPPATPYLEEDGTSLLISCSTCSIRVHTSQCTVLNSEQSLHERCRSVRSQSWMNTVTASVLLCFRLLRCGSSHRQQGLEVCSLQG